MDILLKDVDLKKLFADESEVEDETEVKENSTLESKVTSTDSPDSDTTSFDSYQISKDFVKDFTPSEDFEWIFTEDNATVESYDEQRKELETHHKELKEEFTNWKIKTMETMEKQNMHLLQKQELLLNLEAKNMQLEDDLKKRQNEYESTYEQFRKEKVALRRHEMDLETQATEFDEQAIKIQTQMKQLESESLQIESDRSRLEEDQIKFANDVKEFKNRVSEAVADKLKQQIDSSHTELADEWTKLHSEEEKLSQIYHDMLEAKNRFEEKVKVKRQELLTQQEALTNEWTNVKKLRKELEDERQRLIAAGGQELNVNHLVEVDAEIKKKIEDEMLTELEGRIREEITEQVTKEQEGTKTEIGREWAKLRAEQKKLAQIQTAQRRGRSKFKANFESKLGKLKKLFKKNKRDTAIIDALEVEFHAHEEKRRQDLETEENRRQELEDFARNLKTQRSDLDDEREEIAEEWKYLNKIMVKVMEESSIAKPKDEDTKSSDDSETEKIDTKVLDEEDSELTKELKKLQAELKDEWSELKAQHDSLDKVREKFARAKSMFENQQDKKTENLDKFPISNLGFDKSE
jgi:hypothetical protein